MATQDATPEVWFRDLGYEISVSREDDDIFWATLTAVANPSFIIERYGRGATEEEAAESARRRWQVEQVGSMADQRQGRDRRLP
jgi:hypothetical protein